MYVCGYPTIPAKKYPPWTFFLENLQKIMEDLHLFTKKSEIWIFCAIECDRHGLTSWWMTWVYLNLTRLCFSFPHALCIQKNYDKKIFKKNPTYLPHFFEHVTWNTYIIPFDLKFTSTYETGINDNHHMIYTMLKSCFQNTEPKL